MIRQLYVRDDYTIRIITWTGRLYDMDDNVIRRLYVRNVYVREDIMSGQTIGSSYYMIRMIYVRTITLSWRLLEYRDDYICQGRLCIWSIRLYMSGTIICQGRLYMSGTIMYIYDQDNYICQGQLSVGDDYICQRRLSVGDDYICQRRLSVGDNYICQGRLYIWSGRLYMSGTIICKDNDMSRTIIYMIRTFGQWYVEDDYIYDQDDYVRDDYISEAITLSGDYTTRTLICYGRYFNTFIFFHFYWCKSI